MIKALKKTLSIAAAAVIAISAFSFTGCAHTHKATDPVRENEVQATCTKEGSYDEVVYCASCDEEMSRVEKTLEKAPHTKGEVKREDEIAPSCTVAGSYDEVYYCTVCDNEISRETKTVEKTAHKPGEPVTENVKHASCTTEGSYDEVVYCLDCKTEIKRTPETTDKTEHNFETNNSATEHWKECTACETKKDTEAHIPGPAATETSAQKCTECGYVISAPIGHTHELSLKPAVSPTCLSAGSTAYYTCSGCGKYFEDEDGKKEILSLSATIVPAAGHSFSTEWSKDGDYHWHAATCEHTQEVSERGAHDYDDGTLNSEGTEITYSCTDCGSAKNKHVVTFKMNMEGEENKVVYVNDGERVEKPATPTHDGFTFQNWYSDEECTQKFKFDTAVTGGMTIYASWRGTYVFEAEDTYLDDLEGKGFSNDAYGTEMIQADYQGKAKASGGYFVGYMYNYGLTITYEFESNKDDVMASLKLRLSGELVSTVTFTNEKYLVEVNGVKVNYSDITISDISTDKSERSKREFQDFDLGRVMIQKGKNVITLKVNNRDSMQGTMNATAPLLDCIKITTTAALTFDKTDNPRPQ